MLFNTLVILNVNNKNLFIKNIREEVVTIPLGYETQQELKTYLDVSHWASNNLLQRSYLSTYSEYVLDMLEGYTRGPLMDFFGKPRDELLLNHRELDFNRFYTDILAKLDFVPVVNQFDHFKQYDGHELKKHYLYFVEKLVEDQSYPPEKFTLC